MLTILTVAVKGFTLRFLTDEGDIARRQGVGVSQKRQLTPLSLRLKAARKTRELTADRIAEALDCSPSTVRHWWTARSEPSFETLDRYAELCGVSSYWLITGKPDEQAGVTDLLGELVDAYAAGTLGEAWAQKRFGERVARQSVEDPRFQQALNWLLEAVQEEFGRDWDRLTPVERRSVLDHLVQEIRGSLAQHLPPPGEEPPSGNE